MPTCGPAYAWNLVVAMTYGQFVINGSWLEDPDVETALCEEALAGPGIAGTDRTVLILSPHQANIEMALRVEVWHAEPPADLDDWQEAFDASLDVDSAGKLTYASPTLESHTVGVAAGRYRLRVVGRGFVRRGWPGSVAAGDHWRLQLWPDAERIVPRRLRAFVQPTTAADGGRWTHPPPTRT